MLRRDDNQPPMRIDLSKESHQRFVMGRRRPLTTASVSPQAGRGGDDDDAYRKSPKECLGDFLRGLENVKSKSKELNDLIRSTRELMSYKNLSAKHGESAIHVLQHVERITSLFWLAMRSHSADQIIKNVLPSAEDLSLHQDVFRSLGPTILAFVLP